MKHSAIFSRSELLVGVRAMERLSRSRVILFGVGGVGGWCAEALIRSGIGALTLVDSDAVCITNVNRQIQATTATVGKVKVEELAARLRQINPQAELTALPRVYNIDTRDGFALESYDYIVDAIDSLSPKLGLIMYALTLNGTLFSSMGASARLDPTRVRIGSIWESKGCPLAKRIRKRLHRHHIERDFQVVYSDEPLVQLGSAGVCGTADCFCPKRMTTAAGECLDAHEWCGNKAHINGSMVHVTAVFGMFLASLVVNDVVAKAAQVPTPAIS